MTRPARRWALPVFVRIFVLMVLALLLVQVLNFAIVLLVPPPTPRLTPLDDIAAALKGDRGPGSLTVNDGTPINADRPDPRSEPIRHAVADRLSLDPAQVRVRTSFPSLFGPPHGGPPRSGMMPPPVTARGTNGDVLLVGNYAISAEIGDQWRTVRPASGDYAPWRSRALIWLLITMLVVAPVAWWMARLAARPIHVFAAAAERLGRDPRAPPLDVSGPPEIGEAAAAFNEMQARLNRYVEDRTTLMAAIAHDLRTPLMRLQLRLEQAPAAVRDACETDVRDMEAMIAAVMSFVRDMTRPTRHQPLDLRSLAESVVDGFEDAGERATLAPGSPIVVDGDAPSLKAMIANLIGNAVKYAGGAHITLRIADRQALIEVADRGPGIAVEDIDRVFEPFFRSERSRNRDTGGAGLGLASVRAVARAHGGDATLANRPDGGLMATVSLPLTEAEISRQ